MNLAYYHPLIIHAPLVLIPIAVVFSIGDRLFPRAGLRLAAALLLLLGAGGALPATQTGEAAERVARQENPGVRRITVSGPVPQAIGNGSLLETHATLGDLTAYLYGALFVVEAGVLFASSPTTQRWRGSWALSAATARVVRGTWLVVAVVGIVVVVLTGYYGGQLVYDHGIGVTHSVTNAPKNVTP